MLVQIQPGPFLFFAGARTLFIVSPFVFFVFCCVLIIRKFFCFFSQNLFLLCLLLGFNSSFIARKKRWRGTNARQQPKVQRLLLSVPLPIVEQPTGCATNRESSCTR